MATLKIPNKLARELADINAPSAELTPDEPQDGWNPSEYGITEVVENRHTGEETRWSSVHELVIRTKDGSLWQANYTQGLTECQDERPFEDEGPEVKFLQVKPVPVTHFEYKSVD